MPAYARRPATVRGVALVAVGGYGRGELSPRSDLEVVLLHDGHLDAPALAHLADQIWYPIWDAGLPLDHSVRTLAEARTAAARDLRAHLALLDARHVAGDAALTARLRSVALADWRASARQLLPQLHELCQERARRHGELRFLLEPDLREAHGGLRDVTALRAVAASWLADAPRPGLERACHRLLDVRDTLHLVTGRATARLALQDQGPVAARLDLPNADALLRQVYASAGTIAYAADVTWREVERVLRTHGAGPRRRGRPRGTGHGTHATGHGARSADGARTTPLAEGVVEYEGEAVLARAARPDRDPVLPLRAAAAAAQAGLRLPPHTARRLADAKPLPTPWPPEARERLVALLGAGEALVPVWEALEAEGLISQLLPDWERVRCRPQRHPAHRWTVDRHLIETAAHASALGHRVSRPDLLLFAALLHDIGKGWPGDHSVAGETIARDTAARIGLGASDAATLATLVRHRLLLVETATRRDLDDPATVRSVARAVSSRPTLELLHALTEAAATATGPAAWSAWRASLVADLVRRVTAYLAGEHTAPRVTAQPPPAEQERLAVQAWHTGEPALALHRPTGPHPAATARPHAGAEPVGDVLPLAAQARAPQEAVGLELLIAAPAGPDTLAVVAGVLALHGLTVRSAALRAVPPPPTSGEGPARRGEGRETGPAGGAATGRLAARATSPHRIPAALVTTPRLRRGWSRRATPAGRGPTANARPAAVSLLTWRVAVAYGAPPQAERLRHDLIRALHGTLDIATKLAERENAYPPRRGALAPSPRVTVVPDASPLATVLEVRAQDAPGLLHRVSRALECAVVTLRSAHIDTLGAHAVDTFYVTDTAGAPLSAARAASLARTLERALR
ncbi:[protein-PII] uridylyltransferase [Streptomyces sp. NPDC057702]|uniref:[protein-PII] uridylyltransferase n=1 Tax=unclassified Streptomyces TaxID=2593676 RepID=UPI00369B8500